MVDCVILGDSIGVGVSQFLPQCISRARVGNRTTAINPIDATVVIISTGSNDYGYNNAADLERVRSQITGRVVWILPANPLRRLNILNISTNYNDSVVELQNISSDRVHPTIAGYREIALQIRLNHF
jgi:lysophospholipase L1-like esterase